MLINLNDFVKKLYQEQNEKDLLIINGIYYFLEYYKHNKRVATFNFYRNKLNLINEYLKSTNINYFSQLNDSVILNYISYMQKRNNKNSTINKNIGVLKTLISFLEKHDLIQSINFKVDKLKETNPNIKILDLSSIKLIVDYISKFSNRKQLIFYLFASTGIRRTELVNIKKTNININNNSIYLEHTKSGHARFIYFSDMVKTFIIYELNRNIKSEYLFCEENGVRLSPSKIDNFFKKIKRDLNLKNFSPHILRHTYATAILKQTDLETVRLLLGHQTYEMTKRYLHLENSKLKNDSILFNPLDLLLNK